MIYLLSVLYVILASIKLKYPGINYDEIIFGNAALGGIDNTFIYYKIKNFPLLIMPYISTLKSFLYYPLFKIFGVSAITIRFPMIIITALSLIILYKSISVFFNKSTALLTIIFVICDASFIVSTRMDQGPFVLEFLFKNLSLYYFVKLLNTKKNKYFFYLLLSLFLGFINKMNFIWYSIALFISTIIFYREYLYKNYWKKINKNLVKVLYVLILLSTIFILFLFYKFNFFSFVTFTTFSHLKLIVKNSFNVITGQYFFNFFIGNLESKYAYIYFTIVFLSIFINLILRLKNNNKSSTPFLFFLLIIVFIYIQIILTKNSGAGWHIMMLYPFITVLLANSILCIFNKKTLITLIVCVIAIYQIKTSFLYIKYFDAHNIKNIFWSAKIYDLIDYTKKSKNKFVSVDWGTHNQLLVFNQEKGKYFEAWPVFVHSPMSNESQKYVLNNYYNPNNNYIFILHTEKNTSFPTTRANFFSLAQINNIRLIKVKVIKDQNETIFELYKSTKNSSFSK